MNHHDFIDKLTGEVQTLRLLKAFDRLASEVEETREENAALTDAIKKCARRETALTNRLKDLHQQGPRAHEVREVVEYWADERLKLPGTRKVKIDLSGAGAQKVRARLNQKPDSFTVEELKEAIDGAMAKPYVGPQGRQAERKPGCTMHIDLDLICREAEHVNRFRGYVRQGPPKLELVHSERTIRDAKSKAGLSTWPDTLGGGRERRAELADTLRLIAVTLKQWERREREAA